jgi:hypothetical protein
MYFLSLLKVLVLLVWINLAETINTCCRAAPHMQPVALESAEESRSVGSCNCFDGGGRPNYPQLFDTNLAE